MLATLSAALVMATPNLKVDYVPFQGLTVSLDGIPVIEGSGFQYYERGWTRGYYSSSWRPAIVERPGDGRIVVRFDGDNGRVAAVNTFTPTEDGWQADYEFTWRGDKPAMLELTLGRLWAPLVADGRVDLAGSSPGRLSNPVAAGSTFEQRLLSPQGANRIQFDAPIGTISLEVNRPALVMDARNYTVDWALGRELFWLGYSDQELAPERTLRYSARWRITPRTRQAAAAPAFGVAPQALPEAVGPETQPLPLVPKPKSVQMGAGFVAMGDALALEGDARFARDLTRANDLLWVRWDRRSHQGTGATPVKVEIKRQNLAAEGYVLTINGQGITISGQDAAGVRHGFQRLVQLARPYNGRLGFPHVTLRDWPSVSWRGVHKFVGPQALAFQSRFMDRVLAPMKFNHMVLECERTDWRATPGIKTEQTMSREDLAALFARYREMGIEPIPLIQSLGHMSWLFANNQNLNLAVNPNVPHTIDSRKKEAREKIVAIWREAHALLRPRYAHFGLDEIDMRGMPDDPGLTTRLWRAMLPDLLKLADELEMKPMMWGDIMLAPGEAIDAMHAESKAEAETRRALLPRGTFITDWHYKDDPNPANYTSLGLWRRTGMNAIASHWFRPNNIRGQTLAAIRNGAGILQTTWAGYTSSEAAMVREFDQFAAYILAADYAWSGREELPKDLPYDPGSLLRRLYFDRPAEVQPVPGFALVKPGEPLRPVTKIGPVSFRMFSPVQLQGVTTFASAESPTEVRFEVGRQAREVAVALDCLAWSRELVPIAEVEIVLGDGTRRKFTGEYGMHVRAVTDRRATMAVARRGTTSAWRISLGERPVAIQAVIVRSISRAAGARVHGVTLK